MGIGNSRGFRNRVFKYNNKKKYCNAGHLHHSSGEARHCDDLQLLVKASEIKGFEIQKRFDFVVNGKKICSHYVDFLITTKEGLAVVQEYKGFETGEWKIKKRLFEALYPQIPYKVIKRR